MKNLSFLFILGFIHINVFCSYSQQNNEYPKTYEEAINKVIGILDHRTKTIIRDSPKFSVRQFNYIIHDNNLIEYKNYDFLTSCAKSIGKKSIHFEDITTVILSGVWDKLNNDLNIVDFQKVEPENYFNSIQQTLKKYKEENRPGYLASLPYWIFKYDSYYETDNPVRNQKLLDEAIKVVMKENEFSYLGLLYLSIFNTNLEEKKTKIDKYYKIENNYFEIPSYNYTYQDTTSNKKEKITSTEYTFTQTEYKKFALECYGIIYEKKFNTQIDYENFIEYCNKNYFAKWKFIETLSFEDYKSLINNPKKLLEILILTDKYCYRERSTHDLIINTIESVDSLIYLIETKEKIKTEYPYGDRLGKYDFEENWFSYKSVNAIKMIANKLTIDELFEILNPISIEYYNKTYKTNDLLDYKHLTSFILATQYKRLLNYDNKAKTFEAYLYYWENQHVSWPFKDFLTNMLIQIDKQKALNIFKREFEDNPTNGSFTRQGILNAIIDYDFKNNSQFIEDWYWKVQGKDFNHRPIEHKLILDLLKEKNRKTLALYKRIKKDKRFID